MGSQTYSRNTLIGNARSAGAFGSQDGNMRQTNVRKKVEEAPREGTTKNNGLLDENGNEYFELCLQSNPNKMSLE